MPKLIDYWRAWRRDRKTAKKPVDPKQALESVSPETKGLVYRAGLGYGLHSHRFGLTWDDAEQRFTMLGPMTPVYSMGWTDTDLERLLRASAWSWASINGNARAMGQLTPIVQESVGGKWQKAPEEHPLWSFIRDPLGEDPKFPYWSWSHLFYVTALHYYAAGNSWHVPFASMRGLSVVPLLSPQSMMVDEADKDKYGVPQRYKYPAGLQSSTQPEMHFTPDSIINIMAPAPGSYWEGSSPLRAALRSTEIDHVATERQRYELRNRMGSGPIVSMEYGGPTEEQRQQIREEIINQYREPENEGDPIILGHGAKVDRGHKPDELQVFETKNSARDEIIATIGTQPSILGQLDRATYSNTKEATVLWFTSSLNPVLEQIYGCYNAQYIQREHPDSRLWYSLAGSHIGLQLLSAQLDVGERLQKLGYDANEISNYLEMGLPELEEKRARPMPIDVVAGRVEADGDQPEDEEPPADEESGAPPLQAVE